MTAPTPRTAWRAITDAWLRPQSRLGTAIDAAVLFIAAGVFGAVLSAIAAAAGTLWAIHCGARP